MAQNNSENENLKIGEIAARSGVSIDTLRYYERLGLLPKAPRASSGYRIYDQRIIDRLGFIRRAQSFGFTLDEIRMMMQLERASSKTCSSVLQVLRHKLDDLDRRHKEILRLKRELSRFKNACEHALACGESCPVIEDFVKLRSAAGDKHSAESGFPIGTENSDRVKEALQSACGLTLLTEKLAGLSPREDRVRRFILESYPRLGRAPKLSEIKANLSQYSSEQIEQICQKLHALDIIYIPEGSKELAGAYPFIDFRKDHLVRFVSGKAQGSVHAMCAIDDLSKEKIYD